MKGKISFYYNAPNTSKVRTRIENPSKELTGQIREALKAAVIETLNESTLAIRAKMIEKFSNLNLTCKDKRYVDQLQNVMNPYFDAIFQAEPFAGAEEEETTEESTGAPEEAPAEEAADTGEKKAEDFD